MHKNKMFIERRDAKGKKDDQKLSTLVKYIAIILQDCLHEYYYYHDKVTCRSSFTVILVLWFSLEFFFKKTTTIIDHMHLFKH